jgi:hypothetical protein
MELASQKSFNLVIDEKPSSGSRGKATKEEF